MPSGERAADRLRRGALAVTLAVTLALACAAGAVAGATGASAAPVAAPGTLTFFAGTGTAGPASASGTTTPATSSPLRSPEHLGVDAGGVVYVADRLNRRVSKIDPATGYLTYVAGDGQPGWGSSGTAFQSIGDTTGVAVDGADTWITDAGNASLFKITGGMMWQAVNGNVLRHPADVVVDTDHAVYVADRDANTVLKRTAAGVLTVVAGGGTTAVPTPGVSQPATATRLSTPRGLAVDAAKNVYIADQDSGRILRVTPTGDLTVVAGTPAAASGPATAGDATSTSLDHPAGLDTDPAGNLYIANTLQHQVLRVTPAGALTVVAGTGAPGAGTSGAGATSSRLDTPVDVAVGPQGQLYISNAGTHQVYEVTPAPGTVPAITSGAPTAVATAGVAYSSTPTATGAPTRTWSTSSGALPAGLALDPATGAITGTPSATGTSTFTLRVSTTAGHDELAASIVVSAPTAPGAPTGATAVAGTASATVSWGAPSADGGRPVTSYTATASPGGATCTTAATSCTVTGLAGGTPHTFTVVATNSVGSGSASAPSSPVVPGAAPAGAGPGAPPQRLTTAVPATVSLGSRTFALNAVATSTGTAAGGGAGGPAVAGGGLVYASATPAVCSVDASGVVTAHRTGTCSVVITAAATPTSASTSTTTTTTITAPESSVAVLPAGAQRFAGPGRVHTSADIAARVFPTPEVGASRDVVIATAGSSADSVPGSRLAGQVGGPLLLTDGATLSEEAAAQVRRLVSRGGTVYLLGGRRALSDAVEEAVGGLVTGDTVVRIGGQTRYETAVVIADATVERAGDVGPIYLVTGRDPADGASVAAYAQSTGGVVLLTDGDELPAATAAYLREHDPRGERATAIGAPARAAALRAGLTGAASRAVAGADRFDTAAQLAAAMKRASVAAPTASTPVAPVVSAGLAGGDSWPDALSGSAAMAALGGPLLLTPTGSADLPASTASALRAIQPDRVLVFGGASAIPRPAYERAAALLEG